MDLEQLRKKIEEANESYRKGEQIMSDYEYDLFVDELKEHAPHDPLLNQIGYLENNDDRKEKLPLVMASMNKVKTMQELIDWFRLKGIPKDTPLVLTPKYDGASFCVYEYTASGWTRGDGIEGQRSDAHCKMLDVKRRKEGTFHTFGEVIMSRVNWKKYEEFYANPRNMVAGMLNRKEPTGELRDCDYIRYGTSMDDFDKTYQVDICNKINKVQMPYELVTLDMLSDDYLVELYKKWSVDYELDGIIVEVNDATLRAELGRETSTDNPVFARAYKGKFEEIKEATIVDISYQVSKHGYLKPVVHIEPTSLDGVTVKKATAFNAKFVKAMGLGTGAKILIKRSGKVIPFIISVTHRVKPRLDTYCPSCGNETKWKSVELHCDNIDCPAQRLQRIIKFFEILGADNVGEGICKQLYEVGYDTLAKILAMELDDFLALEGFKKRRATSVLKSLRGSVANVNLSKLMHASSCFETIGSKKLALVEHLFGKNPTIDDLLTIKGYSVISAQAYLKGIKCFKYFITELPNVTISLTAKPQNDQHKELVVVFTGVRRKDLEEIIIGGGGKVSGSVSKTTTHLIVKEKGSGSSKEKKALALGTTVWEVSELESFLKRA